MQLRRISLFQLSKIYNFIISKNKNRYNEKDKTKILDNNIRLIKVKVGKVNLEEKFLEIR